jgi:hypothetical protein
MLHGMVAAYSMTQIRLFGCVSLAFALASACGGQSIEHVGDDSGGSGGSGGSTGGTGGSVAGHGGSVGGSGGSVGGTGGSVGGTGGSVGGTGGSVGGTGGSIGGTGGSRGGTGGSIGGTGGSRAGRGGSGGTGGDTGGTAAGHGGTVSAGTGGAAGAAGSQVCIGLSQAYAEAVDAATACDPTIDSVQCTERVDVGLACSCPSFVNPLNATAIDTMKTIAEKSAATMCFGGVTCGACAEPSFGRCANGHCETVYGNGGKSCKVGGKLYADGEGNIPDPTSCNTCSCVDGDLACTEIGCPVPCPDGQSYGKQCAECGPTDACLTVEHGCFPTCQDGCAQAGALCVNGVCITGVCG